MDNPTFIWPGVEVRQLHSTILGQEMEISIKLPWRYTESDRMYPVLYCLDANRAFPLYSTMSLIYETPVTGSSEEIILVGVGYKLATERLRGLAEWMAWRTRDLLPIHSVETEEYFEDLLPKLWNGDHLEVQTGEAERFLRVLRDEVIPFVEANYRGSAAGRGLAAYSNGGLFALYTLFHAPEAFSKYFAGSPSIIDEVFEYEETYAAAHTDLPAEILMTVGSLEEMCEPFERLANQLRSRSYPNLNLKTWTFDGEGHSSVYAAAVSRALRELYYQV